MILLRILKNNRTSGMAGLAILLLAIFIKSFVQALGAGRSGGLVEYTAMPFYNLIFGSIHNSPFLNHLITLSFLLLISYMLIRISVRYVLLQFRSLMPGVFFILFYAVLPTTQQVNPALVGSIFFLLSFAILFDSQDKRPDTFSIFIASMVLVFGSMFYLKLIWYIPLIWISLWTLRQATWREILFPVISFILLGLLLIAWYWGIMDDMNSFVTLIGDNLGFTRSLESSHLSVYIYYGFFLLLVLIASVYMVNRFQTRKTEIQNIYQVLFFMFVTGVLFFTIIARFDTTNLIFMAFPVSYILSNYFHRKKNHWSHELALWIVTGLLVFVLWTA